MRKEYPSHAPVCVFHRKRIDVIFEGYFICIRSRSFDGVKYAKWRNLLERSRKTLALQSNHALLGILLTCQLLMDLDGRFILVQFTLYLNVRRRAG